LKIAIFTNNYLPNPYGVSTSVEGFRLALMKMGHDVFVFAPQWFESFDDDENIFRYPAFKVPTKIDFSLVVPFSTHIDEKIARMDFDVIHAQHPNLLGATGRRWAQKKNVPLIFTWHSLYDRYAHYMPFVPEKISAHLAMKNAATFAQRSDHVIVPTSSIVPLVKSAGVIHNRIDVVESGVDQKLFANPDGNSIRKKFNIHNDAILLTTVSRLTEEKNVTFLAQQIAQILKKNPQTFFLCAGEGDQKKDMEEIFREQRVIDHVVFAGKVARDEVKHFLAAGDIFVYASTSETQGTIVTENMYIGRPIVGVSVNGVGDLIDHKVNGLHADENDSFAHNVQELIDNEDLRKTLGQNAFTIAREKYTSEKCADRLVCVYEKTIAYHHDHSM
jgi:1,2-diacylglycerol 3-alpha-glucosyltransferase